MRCFQQSYFNLLWMFSVSSSPSMATFGWLQLTNWYFRLWEKNDNRENNKEIQFCSLKKSWKIFEEKEYWKVTEILKTPLFRCKCVALNNQLKKFLFIAVSLIKTMENRLSFYVWYTTLEHTYNTQVSSYVILFLKNKLKLWKGLWMAQEHMPS